MTAGESIMNEVLSKWKAVFASQQAGGQTLLKDVNFLVGMTGFINFVLNLVSFKTGVYKAHPIAEGFQQEHLLLVFYCARQQLSHNEFYLSYHSPTEGKAEFVIAFHEVTKKYISTVQSLKHSQQHIILSRQSYVCSRTTANCSYTHRSNLTPAQILITTYGSTLMLAYLTLVTKIL